MILGHGDIASQLVDRDGFIFFASGVSNSKETDTAQFQREVNLLKMQDKTKHLVYFGSLAIFYLDTPYTRHKKFMEEMVKANFKHYTIVRIGNPSWGTNPNTIINYFKNQHAKGEKLEIQQGYRYIVEEKEFKHWMAMIPEWNCEFNITGQFMTIQEIVDKYVYGRKK